MGLTTMKRCVYYAHTNRKQQMFTLDNTEGFTQAECNLMNQAVRVLTDHGMEEKNASAIVNNNWQEGGNTVESLTQ